MGVDEYLLADRQASDGLRTTRSRYARRGIIGCRTARDVPLFSVRAGPVARRIPHVSSARRTLPANPRRRPLDRRPGRAARASAWALTPDPALAATKTWSGLGGDANWMAPGNWMGGVAPVPGDDLVFPAGASQPTNTNNFPAGTLFTSLTIQSAGYTLNGNLVSIGNGIGIGIYISATHPSGTTSTINLPISGTDTLNIGVLNESARLVFGGGVNNADPINNGGLGTVVLLASGSTSSGWTVYGGPLNLQTGGALGSGPVTFWFGGSLQLQGGITIPNALSNDVSVESVSGNNTLTGPITLFHAGSFRVAPASTLIVSTNPITFTTSGVNLQVVVDGALTISSSIQGPGGLTKGGHIGEATGGTGPLTLSGANTYVGQTTVAVGPLLVTGNQPNSPVFVSQGATLGGTGTTGPITVGGTVAPG